MQEKYRAMIRSHHPGCGGDLVVGTIYTCTGPVIVGEETTGPGCRVIDEHLYSPPQHTFDLQQTVITSFLPLIRAQFSGVLVCYMHCCSYVQTHDVLLLEYLMCARLTDP